MPLRKLTVASCAVLLWLSLSCIAEGSGANDLRFAASVRPPCVKIPGSDRDPCERTLDLSTQPNAESSGHSDSDPPLPIEPEWLYRLEWSRQGSRTPQLVVRGIVAPNSSRCSEVNAYHIGGHFGTFEATSPVASLVCHADFDVSEYVVGSGPARFPFIAYWQHSLSRDAHGYGTVGFFSQQAFPVRDELEGVEFIIEFAHSHDLAWGDWMLLHAWDIQRRSDGTIVGRSGMWHYHTRSTDVEDWEIPIGELQPKLKAAHAKVAAEYGGRISDEPDSPMLVTNASRSHLLAQLRELGAYDSPDITPVPAPPAPRIRFR